MGYPVAHDTPLEPGTKSVPGTGFKGVFHQDSPRIKDGDLVELNVDLNYRTNQVIGTITNITTAPGAPLYDFSVCLDECGLSVPMAARRGPGGVLKVNSVYFYNCQYTAKMHRGSGAEACTMRIHEVRVAVDDHVVADIPRGTATEESLWNCFDVFIPDRGCVWCARA
jgi:hypothetical protein